MGAMGTDRRSRNRNCGAWYRFPGGWLGQCGINGGQNKNDGSQNGNKMNFSWTEIILEPSHVKYV
jgi:hypothetical protein